MPTRIRTHLAIDAERRNLEQLARAGGEVCEARRRKRLTQRQLGERVGLSQAAISRAERGHGGGLTMDAWQRIGLAVDRPLVVTLQRDTAGETADAGHLAIQELVLRLGREAGYAASFEIPTRPAEPWRSADVGLRNESARRLILVECWNTIGDVGAAPRERTQAGGRRGARGRAVGRGAGHRRCRLGRAGVRAQPRAPGPLPGGLRCAVPRVLAWLDPGAHRLDASPRGTRDRLV